MVAVASPSLSSLLIPFFFLGQMSAFTHGTGVPFGRAGSEIGDYRLANGEPFVTLFEHENFRGKIYRQKISKECLNIPIRYWDWSSSLGLHGRCVTLCDAKNCGGNCVHLYPPQQIEHQKGVKRLSTWGINDKAKSLKFCYQQFNKS